MAKKLNTLKSFKKEGFKIERNGEIITLTQEEMVRFFELDKALDGYNILDFYSKDCDLFDKKQMKAIDEMMESEEYCFAVKEDFDDRVYYETGELERDAVKCCIQEYWDKCYIEEHPEFIEQEETGITYNDQ